MTSAVRPVYPAQYETEVVLRDGSLILFRPIKVEDVDEWLAFIGRLSNRTKYLRFGYVPREFTREEALRYCDVDYQNTFAFVAEAARGGKRVIVAIGRYYRLPDQHSAEVAFVTEDVYHGRGIGTKMMEWLSNVARDNGINTFQAEVLAENEQMMGVFRDYGFHLEAVLEGGEYQVSFPIARTRRVARKEEERERTAITASVKTVLAPRSVAVIGASQRPGTIGRLLTQCILQSGYTGTLYPVNPTAPSIMAVKAYPSVLDIPGEVEMAVIAVPAVAVARVAEECGRKGVRSLVVISDGFKERGAEGAARERELREIALGHGMRLVGPNCMGVVNTEPGVMLNATFSQVYPPEGKVAFLSQSGAMGLVILEYARDINLGISSFVSVGNRADIAANDLVQYWEQDPNTRVILLYLESFGSPRQFSRIARRASASKPILVVKSGRTLAGSRAASSHTGALATSELVTGALFRQAGIIRVNAVEELFDVAALLSHQPVPRGKRLAIVTNGGGPGIIAADACEEHGIALPEFSEETRAALKEVIQRELNINNPLDITAGASAEEFEGILKILVEDQDNDAVLAIFIPPVTVNPEVMADALRRVSSMYQRVGKPLVACFIGQKGFQGRLGARGRFIPCYLFPEDAVRALAKGMEYGELARQPKGKVPRISGLRCVQAQTLMEKALSRSVQRPLWLSPGEITELLHCYGIRFVETLLSRSPEEAAKVARQAGFPVAVKLASPTISHKTEVGGVILDLKSEGEVKEAFAEISRRLAKLGRESEMEGVTIQRMVPSRIEAIVGVTQDPSFGSLIMFGLGGTYAEMIKDVAMRLHPLTDLDAHELVRSIRMAKVFEGFRGAPPSDTAALEDLLLRLSAMVEDLPQIAELDFNPVAVMPRGEGYWVVDARILVK